MNIIIGYNRTRCGPPPEYCNKTQGCRDKLKTEDFVKGLNVTSWVAVAKVSNVQFPCLILSHSRVLEPE